MRIAVCVKHAVDETELRLDPSGKPTLDGAASKMSTFDKNAVEEAVRVKAAHQGEVVAFSVGSPEAKKSLKEALAMGADRGVLIAAPLSGGDTLSTAEALAAGLRKEGPFDLIICSEGSSDIYSGQVPPMVAELTGLSYIGYAKSLAISEGKVVAERSLEESVEKVEAPLPAVVSVVSEINEPRYPTLIQIMQSSKKPMSELSRTELSLDDSRKGVAIISMTSQQSNRKHVIIEGTPAEAAAKLVAALKTEGVL